MEQKMTLGQLQTFMDEHFPQVASDFTITEAAPMRMVVKYHVDERHIRPGNTISGPTQFTLADVSVYLAILAMVGPKALAVTTNCSIDFMRKPAAGRDLIAETRLLKLGRVLAVGDVLIHSDGQEAPVARASLTYSLPPGPIS
ncbi:MAG TPA: PaaI family thioesterase [Aliiroseovarius sp.]|nr:PaaI family thioesterase [Aliiroseovarius sp.]